MQTIPLSIDSDEIRAYLDFSLDPNPIHRDPVSARKAALALSCAGKQADPSTIDRIAWGPWESIIVPGAYASLKSICAIASQNHLNGGYAISDISIKFSAPMIAPMDSPLETLLTAIPRDAGNGHVGFDLAITGESITGQETEYQRITAEFARTDSTIWAERSNEPLHAPKHENSSIWANMIYNHPILGKNAQSQPFLGMINARDGLTSGLCYLLSLIPAALMTAPVRLKGNTDYQSLFAEPHKRIIEENERRKESWARYEAALGPRPTNSDGEVHAYLSQTLRFNSPVNIRPDNMFSAVVSLQPEGVSKNTGRLVFQNHGYWCELKNPDIDRPYFTGKSDVIALPAYPRQVIERAISRHDWQNNCRPSSQTLP